MTTIKDIDFSRRNLKGKNLDRLVFEACNFAGAELQGASMKGSQFIGCTFQAAYLTKADLSGAEMQNCILSVATFKDANLAKAQLRDCRGTMVVMRGANLQEAILHGCTLQGDFSRLKAKELRIVAGEYTGSIFTGSELHGLVVDNTGIGGCKFVDCSMPHAMILNSNAQDADFTEATMTNVRLQGSDLLGARFARATLGKPVVLDCKGVVFQVFDRNHRAFCSADWVITGDKVFPNIDEAVNYWIDALFDDPDLGQKYLAFLQNYKRRWG